MMKAKHYIYARLVTALLSTSTIAGVAVTDDANFIKSITKSCGRIAGQPVINDDQKNYLLNQSKNFLNETQEQNDKASNFGFFDLPSGEETQQEIDNIKISGFKRADVHKYADLASLAYSNTKSRQKLVKEYQSQGYKISHFGTSREESGFILSKGSEVIVSYRGTDSLRDLAVDLNGVMNTSSFTQGRFHTGFYHEFKESWDEVYTVINAHARKNNLDLQNLKVTFTGHSLGGGLAGIAATRWAEQVNADNVSLVNFAAPKFCDTKAARRIEELFGDRILRITQHGYDIVPGVGPGIMGYQAVGKNLRVTAEFWSDMHLMGAYQRLLKGLDFQPHLFKASDSVRAIYRGGYFNPVNIIDSFIKYGVNEIVVGNIQSGFSMFRKKIFGGSTLIENDYSKKDKAADQTFKKNLITNFERNLKIMQTDKLALDSADASYAEHAKNIEDAIKHTAAELKSIKAVDAKNLVNSAPAA